jgi:hypothetical protein
VNITVKKTHNSLGACRKTFDATQDLWPEVVCWLQLSTVRLSITYISSLVTWMPESQCQEKAKEEPKTVCLETMVDMSTTPTGALEALTCLPPHSVVVQGEARSAAH